MTGSGTQTDPYIVDNWADFSSVAMTTACTSNYVKWADNDNKVCDLSEKKFTNAITIFAKSVDFNGWKLTNIKINNLSNNVLTAQANHRIFNIWCETFKNVEFDANVEAYYLFYVSNLYCQFTNVYANIVNTKNNTYVVYSNWVDVDNCTRFNKCIFKITQKHGTIISTDTFSMVAQPQNYTGGAWFENCEIELDLSDISPRSDIANLFSASDYDYGYKLFHNCYVHGNIGNYTGVFTPTNMAGFSNTIFDFQYNSDSLQIQTGSLLYTTNLFKRKFEDVGYQTVWSPEKGMPVFFVNNKQITYTSSGTSDDEYLQKAIISSDDLKKFNLLSTITFDYQGTYGNFSISQDDGIRYPQFGNTTFGETGENWTFRMKDEVNDGKPFLPFWKYKIIDVEPAAPVQQMPMIRVHDGNSVRIAENKDYNFTTNGIRIIRPISCKVTHELNSLYACELEHHIDNEGDWLTLSENNILAVPILYHGTETTQLFRIVNRKVTMKQSGEKRLVVTAYHIWYDLSARAIADATVTNLNGYSALYYLFNAVYINDDEYEKVNKYWYNYSFSSDITDTYSTDYTQTTLSATILGEDNSIVNKLGGYLYRDNFYFSINSEMENAVKNENIITYGTNMLEIEEAVDWSNFANYVTATDNYGNVYAVSWADFYGGELGKICKVLKFNYDTNDFDQFTKDVNDYFGSICKPVASYRVKFAQLHNTELYKDFINLQNSQVGDTVTIKNERLNVTTECEIVRTVYDVLKRQNEEIELGEQQGSLIKKSYMSDTVFRSSSDVRSIQKFLKSWGYGAT